jgi:hypothetical protein
LGKRDLFASLATPNLLDQREWPTRLVDVRSRNEACASAYSRGVNPDAFTIGPRTTKYVWHFSLSRPPTLCGPAN